MIHQKRFLKLLIIIIGLNVCSGSVQAQILHKIFRKKKSTLVTAPPASPKPKTYDDIISKNFITLRGLFTVHKNKDSILFEIPDSILHRDIMVINRLAKATYGISNYPGEELDKRTIQFELGPDSTIRIRYDLVVAEADSNSNIYKAVKNSEVNPIAYTFPIVIYGKDRKSYVIDVTKLFKEASFLNNISSTANMKQNDVINVKDFDLDYAHAYPINMEFGTSANVDILNIGPGNIKTSVSFLELPKVPMMRRYRDERVGYFFDGVTTYTDDQQKIEERSFIARWRLEPRDEDVEKWKRGELVEPKKPIVIYIDPATPKQWQPYLIAGINDWQKAFEQAGFKNAIIGKAWPENDTTMHMEDARYSFINYFPSEIANAYGPNVHDPRSGEIMQTHIGWYANVMTLLHNWYMTQCGATDPRARKPKFDDELMGQLIRFVSSHEVGHTLGLLHNFGSSSQTPVDSLRNKHYLDVHGHTASIMDYARFNYVAQPEDNIPENDLFPRIGEYDKWAIEWGYKSSGAPNADDDKKIVSDWIAKRTTENPRLLWITGEFPELKFDPRAQTEDLSDNPVIASNYGIKNLQYILPNLPQWTYEEGNLNQNLADEYQEVRMQYYRYLNHVMKYVGGYEHTYKSEDQKEPVFTPVPIALQRQLLVFFNEQVFNTPYWLMNNAVLDKIEGRERGNFIGQMQEKVLNSLLDIDKLNKVRANEIRFGAKQSLTLAEYIGTIHHDVWERLNGKGPVKEDSYRRNLQKIYFGAMNAVLSTTDLTGENDALSIVRADLEQLQGEIKKAESRTLDPLTLEHFKDLEDRIKHVLNTKSV
jgi:hypothetical protein